MKKIILILFITTLFVQSSFFAHSKFEVAENEEIKSIETESILVRLNSPEFLLNVPQTGRYQVSIWGNLDDSTAVWIEDYINNKDERTYNITGSIILNEVGKGVIDGSPLAKGEHQMKLHSEGESTIDSIRFDLIQHHLETDSALVQNMSGSGWSLVWSDEFNGAGLADDSKWIYNVGNWGWGNNELQYYTSADLKNARQENGSLIIEAHKNEKDKYWSSARLTTQSKVSFKYGRIEFRAKVPAGRGTWAAGWLLGDTYQDELSWPYCGEIDVLECVGYEINDTTGYGINHATCHTRAYYFKQGNQIGSEIEVDSMHNKFHTYAVEWYPTKIEGYLDGELYYTYDKNADSLEWPFNQPQNIIINLAIGGGWGGKKRN
ncbi:glycoside hydrolase family 16 protein [Vicingaceae bacterium]|nr:glycoside hydrolase family 16 protein [Vicingaceae bacterium]